MKAKYGELERSSEALQAQKKELESSVTKIYREIERLHDVLSGKVAEHERMKQ